MTPLVPTAPVPAVPSDSTRHANGVDLAVACVVALTTLACRPETMAVPLAETLPTKT